MRVDVAMLVAATFPPTPPTTSPSQPYPRLGCMEDTCGANQSCVPAASFMAGTHVCLCDELSHIWSVDRPADCSGCDSKDACGGVRFGVSRSSSSLVVKRGDGSEQAECVCQCTSLFSGLSCNTSLTTRLPVSPEVGVGITFGTVATIGVVMACLLYRSGLAGANHTAARKMLIIEFIDWVLDWITFALAFYEADLQFHNDPDEILRTLLLALCGLSTTSWYARELGVLGTCG